MAKLRMLLLLLAFFYTSNALASFGSQLCKNTEEYDCYVTKRGDTWAKLFPNQREFDLEIRLNRLGNELKPGMRIAIPKNIDDATAMDFAPFPKQITPPGEKIIVVSISELAWGAYDERGDLVHWGPVSTAKGYCPDIKRRCNTVTGKFAMYSKQGADCVSTKFPVPRGGAPMPYCMFFHKGFAMHGSHDIPGYNASHGCVRMLIEDAKWLNEEFLPPELGTPVIINR